MRKITSILILFLFFNLVVMCVFNNAVRSATGDITIENWDSLESGYNVGKTNGTGVFGTWCIMDKYETSNSSIDNTYVYSSPKTMKLNGLTQYDYIVLYYNLTSPVSFLNSLSIGFKATFTATAGKEVYLSVQLYNGTKEILWSRLMDYGNYVCIQYRNVFGGTITPVDFLSSTYVNGENFWYNLTWSSHNEFNYDVFKTGTGSLNFTNTIYNNGSSNDYDGYVDSIVLTLSTSNDPTAYGVVNVDDIIINTESTTDETGGYGSVSDYIPICEEELNQGDVYYSSEYKYLENEFNLPFIGTVRAVDLFISSDQYGLVSSSLSDYTAYCNGIPLGIASYFVPYGSDYILRWYNKNVYIENEKPTFEFYSNDYITLNDRNYYWWNYGVVPSGGEHRTGSTLSKYGDGEYNQPNNSPFGLHMCFYYTQISYGCDYTDSITILPNSVHYPYESIKFEYTLYSNINTYMQLYNGVTKYELQGYADDGRKLTLCSGAEDFIPYESDIGTWTVNIVRAGVNITSKTFTVTDRSNLYEYNAQIWTEPSIISIGESFLIKWLYNSSYFENKKGFVAYTITDYFGYGYKTLYTNIYGDELGGRSMSFSDTLNHIVYIWLCVDNNGTYQPIDKAVLTIGNYYGNNIWTDKTSYTIDYVVGWTKPVALVELNGYHNHVNENIYVLLSFPDGVNSKENVGVNSEISLMYNLYDAGNYYVSLIIDSGVDTIELANCSFIVQSKSTNTGIGGMFDLIYAMDGGLKILIGFMMVFLFVLAPIGLQFAFNILSLPLFVYLLSASVGLAFTVALGLLPIWIPFFIIVIGIILVFLMYFKDGVTGGGDLNT